MTDWDTAAARQASFPEPADEESELRNPLLGGEQPAPLTVPDRPLGDINVRMQNEVLRFHQHIEEITKLADQLGTGDDSRQLRKRITDQITDTEDLSSSINLQFRESALVRKGAPRSATRDFQKEVARFQTIVREVMDTQQRYRLRSMSMTEHASESTGGPSVDMGKVQVRIYENFEREELEERDREISTIQHTMETVNQIYKDLAVILDEQRGDVEDIEAQVLAAHTRAFGGKDQLDKAATSQKSTGRTVGWILAILIVIGVIVIAVFLGTDVGKK